MTWRLCDADWNHWPDGLDDGEIWAACAAEGFQGVEIGVYDHKVGLAPERLARLSELAARHGVPVAMVLVSLPESRWPVGALTSPHALPAVTALAAAAAGAAAGLGLGTIGLWPGADRPNTGGPEGTRLALREGVAAVAEAIEPTGIRLAVEYKPGTALGDAGEALELCRTVPGVGILLDTSHAFAAREDPAEVVHRLGQRLWHVHLGDAEAGGADDDLPPGRLHDFSAVVAALDTVGYQGAASLDLYGAVCAGAITGVDAAREARRHLEACRP